VAVDDRGSTTHRHVATHAATKPRNATLRIRTPPTLGRLRRLLPLARECFTLISYGLFEPITGQGGDTTFVAVTLPVSICHEKGKYLNIQADTYLCIAAHPTRVGKRLHNFYLLISRIPRALSHGRSGFPFRNLATVCGCGYCLPNGKGKRPGTLAAR